MSLFAELKRRNVFRVSAAYLALGWVITQVTATVVPVLNLPSLIVPIVVWIGAIGFPCVVVFSWVYELTPEGLKRESEIERTASITHETAKRLDTIVIVLLLVAIGLFVFDRFAPRPDATVGESRAEARPTTSPGAAATASADSATSPGAAATASADGEVGRASARQEPAPPATDNSIAVLPFVNMSEDANNAYFADGVSEELLNLLAKIPELRVIARTSSFSFKGKDVDVTTIANTLRVAHVLEGSVRKSGDRVRITAQLVRTSDSSHLWSETYDRKLDDIFAVQSEIAGVVVKQLEITLLAPPPKAASVNAQAYPLFLQARQTGRLISAAGLEQSVALYKQALAIDPAYADAWAGLGRNYLNQSQIDVLTTDEALRLAREALDRTLELDPKHAFACALLGRVALDYDNDLADSARQFERAVALAPSDPDVIGNAAVLAGALRRTDAAFALNQRALELDPLNPVRHNNLGFTFLQANKIPEAIASFRTVLALSPDYLGIRAVLGMALMRSGDAEAALDMAEQEGVLAIRLMVISNIQHTMGHHSESDAALAELIGKYGDVAKARIAAALAFRGETDRAFEWLDKAAAHKEGGLGEITAGRLFDNIKADPRWLPFLRRIGRAPEQLAAVRFDPQLPAH